MELFCEKILNTDTLYCHKHSLVFDNIFSSGAVKCTFSHCKINLQFLQSPTFFWDVHMRKASFLLFNSAGKYHFPHLLGK